MFATVFGKTSGLFKRDENGKVLNEVSDFVTLDFMTNGTFTMKTDGTCGMLFENDDKYYLCRRQDIKEKSRNFDTVMTNGHTTEIAGKQCFVSKMLRGSGKTERTVDVYIFMVNSDAGSESYGRPELEGNHMIGFTPILHDFSDDRHVLSAICGQNGSNDLSLFTTEPNYTIVDNKIKISVGLKSAADILDSKKMITVEIMGNKISDKYNYKSEQHFVNPHGSIIIPSDFSPSSEQLTSIEKLHDWFTNKSNPFADSEGFVIHHDNSRVKCHRGYVGLEHTWTKTKSCSTEFFFN